MEIQRLEKAGFGVKSNHPIMELKKPFTRQSQTLDQQLRHETPTYHSNIEQNIKSAQNI